MKTTRHIKETWTDFDKEVAKIHLANWGIIYLDEYGLPNKYRISRLHARNLKLNIEMNCISQLNKENK